MILSGICKVNFSNEDCNLEWFAISLNGPLKWEDGLFMTRTVCTCLCDWHLAWVCGSCSRFDLFSNLGFVYA